MCGTRTGARRRETRRARSARSAWRQAERAWPRGDQSAACLLDRSPSGAPGVAPSAGECAAPLGRPNVGARPSRPAASPSSHGTRAAGDDGSDEQERTPPRDDRYQSFSARGADRPKSRPKRDCCEIVGDAVGGADAHHDASLHRQLDPSRLPHSHRGCGVGRRSCARAMAAVRPAGDQRNACPTGLPPARPSEPRTERRIGHT